MTDADTLRPLRLLIEGQTSFDLRISPRESTGTVAIGTTKGQSWEETSARFLVTLPKQDGNPMSLVQGQTALLRFVDSGVLYECTTNVVEILGDTVAFSIPQVLHQPDRRRHLRFQPTGREIPVVQWRPLIQAPSNSEDGPWMRVELRDISGCGIGGWIPPELFSRIRVDMRLQLTVKLPETEAPLACTGRVVRLADTPRFRDWKLIGVEFQIPSESEQSQIPEIANYIDSQPQS